MTAPAILLDFANSRFFPPRAAMSRASAGYIRTANGVWVPRPANTGRVHYAPDGRCVGLLVEPQRTNEISNALAPGSWSLTAGIASITTEAGPDGVANTAGLITENTATASHRASVGTVSGVVNTRVAFTAMLRAGNHALAQMSFGSAAGGSLYQNFDLSGAGALGTGTNQLAGIEKSGDWYRCFVMANTATASFAMTIGPIDSLSTGYQASYLGTSRSIRAAWPQVEDGRYPTSFALPAVGAPAQTTRAADVLSVLLATYGLTTPSAGTLVVSGRTARGIDAAAQPLLFLDDGDASDRIALTRETNQTMRAEMIAGSVSQGTATSVATVADNTDFTIACAFAAGDMAISLNGATPVTSTPATFPTGITRIAATDWGGTIARIAYWPQRLSNAQLQSLSI